MGKRRRGSRGGRWTRKFNRGVLPLYESQDGLCFYCERPVPPADATADHFIPLGRGGADRRANKVMACRACNGAKADTMPTVFFKRINKPYKLPLSMVPSDGRESATTPALDEGRRDAGLRQTRVVGTGTPDRTGE